MPSAAELLTDFTCKIAPPGFCARVLLDTGCAERYEAYDKLKNPTDLIKTSLDRISLDSTVALMSKEEIDNLAEHLSLPDRELVDSCTKNLSEKIEVEEEHFIATSIRYTIIFSLAAAGDSRALEYLVEIIDDVNSDDSLKRDAGIYIRLLLNQGVLDKQAVKKNYPSFQEFPMPIDRVPKTVDSLLKLLRSDNPSVRKWAIFSLGTRKDLYVVKHLIEMLSDENHSVRQKAIINLAMTGNPLAVEPFIALLEKDNAENKRRIIFALNGMGDPRAVEPLIKVIWGSIPVSEDVVCLAMAALNSIGDHRATECLIRLFETNEDNPIKMTAAVALAKRGHQKAVKFLEKLLCDPDKVIRQGTSSGIANYIWHEFFSINKSHAHIIIDALIESLKKKQVEKWRLEKHYMLGELFDGHADIIENAISEGRLKETDAIKVIAQANIRNPEAYLKYLLKKMSKNFSYISFLTIDDIQNGPGCCSASLKVGSEAIAVLNRNNEKESIHALACDTVRAAYWS